MPRDGSDDGGWATTRAGLFTNSPKEGLLNGGIVGQRSNEIKDGETQVSIVISHRSETAKRPAVARGKVNAATPSSS
jgi:hypothetical protein